MDIETGGKSMQEGLKLNRRFQLSPILGVLTLCLLLSTLIACGGGGTETDLVLGETEKADAIETILAKGFSSSDHAGKFGAMLATITQEGADVKLILIIDSTEAHFTKEIGREMATEFVKVVKNAGTDEPTGTEIGKGIFNYSVGVYYDDISNPDKTYVNPIRKIVIGEKKSNSKNIKW